MTQPQQPASTASADAHVIRLPEGKWEATFPKAGPRSYDDQIALLVYGAADATYPTQQLRVKSGATVADMRAIAIGAMQFATRVAELAESREVEITRELERQARMDAAKVAADRGVQDVLTATNAALSNESLVRRLIALANAGLATDAERQQLDALRDAALATNGHSPQNGRSQPATPTPPPAYTPAPPAASIPAQPAANGRGGLRTHEAATCQCGACNLKRMAAERRAAAASVTVASAPPPAAPSRPVPASNVTVVGQPGFPSTFRVNATRDERGALQRLLASFGR